MGQRVRRWAATVWCDTIALDELLGICRRECSYFIFQREAAPDTNREHYQCYFEFNTKRRFANGRLADIPGHFEPAKGTAEENRVYCSKPETRIGDAVEVRP